MYVYVIQSRGDGMDGSVQMEVELESSAHSWEERRWWEKQESVFWEMMAAILKFQFFEELSISSFDVAQRLAR